MAEDDDNMLESLLAVATEELEKLENGKKVLKETDIFKQETNVPKREPLIDTSKSNVIHNGDTDSSDDEGNRNYENCKYNSYGKEIKQLLAAKNDTSEISSSFYGEPKKRVSTWTNNPNVSKLPEKLKPKLAEKRTEDVFIDPVFGMRITNASISAAVLTERMLGREAVQFSRISRHIQNFKKDKDWVICGVIVFKSLPKTSQKGSQYSIWTLSDLKDDIKTVALFLFSGAHKDLWKTTVGSVVGVLNPNILDRKDGSKDEAALSVDNAQKIMIFGQSKDYGTCKSVKKNGDKCTAIVNLSKCEYCMYHIKQEYQKCSKRSELQSSFAGKGLTALRNKVLGKNEVFYAGKSYTSIPAKRSKKLEQKDQDTLDSLCKGATTVRKIKTAVKKQTNTARTLDVSHAQRIRDMELLKRLGGSENLDAKSDFSGQHSTSVTLDESKNLATSVINKLKAKNAARNEILPDTNEKRHEKTIEIFEKSKNEHDLSDLEYDIDDIIEKQVTTGKDNTKNDVSREKVSKKSPNATQNKNSSHVFSKKAPVLSGNSFIDLNRPVGANRASIAKLNAIKYIQKHGPIKKSDPNSTKPVPKKRPLEISPQTENPSKKSKLQESEFISDRFKKMMAKTSTHTDLLQNYDDEQQEKYFKKLEAKEKMEEKMSTTYKISCKAVRCLKCKYTSFSASDKCKSERHPLKVFDATKRFFKCGGCGHRTVTLGVVPTEACPNCGSGRWERAGMMKEKLVKVASDLSIRGGEQKFVNSVATDANINLLVPDDD